MPIPISRQIVDLVLPQWCPSGSPGSPVLPLWFPSGSLLGPSASHLNSTSKVIDIGANKNHGKVKPPTIKHTFQDLFVSLTMIRAAFVALHLIVIVPAACELVFDNVF